MDELLGEAPGPVAEEPPAADEPLQLGEDFLEFTPSSRLPSAPAPVAPDRPRAAPTLGGDGEGFDLASELGGLFGAQPAVAEGPAPAAAGTDLGDASLSDIFREFQKGVDKQLGKEDYETRYNLGIAYKEMGLVDEAIAEFQLAAKDESRLLECTSMLGMCFVEKGMPKLAVKWFEKGLAAAGPEATRSTRASATISATRSSRRASCGRRSPRSRRSSARTPRSATWGSGSSGSTRRSDSSARGTEGGRASLGRVALDLELAARRHGARARALERALGGQLAAVRCGPARAASC